MSAPALTRVWQRDVTATSPVDPDREGRAIAYDGTSYADTDQATTDALFPDAAGGVCIQAVDEGEAIGIHLPDSQELIEVHIGSGGCSAGDMLRPEWSAEDDEIDRFVSADEVALPEAAGTYFTTHVALEDGDEGDFVLARSKTVRHIEEA